MFRAMEGRPVTIRLLDPPLHEFLPHTHEEQEALAAKIGISAEAIARRVHELHEFNPMLGHRGCRLGIVYPEITRMQARAIFEAACDVKKDGIDVHPEMMIPLAGFATEFTNQEKIVRETADKVFAEKGDSRPLHGRHDGRAAPGSHLCRSDRRTVPSSSASAPTI